EATPYVHQRVSGGTTYWLQLDSEYDGSTFSLAWRQLSPPGNDDFANATALTADHGSLLGSLDDATREQGEPKHGRYTSATVSVWYRWTAPSSGPATFDLRPETIDDPDSGAELNVYTGSSFAALNRLTGTEEWYAREVAGRVHFDA